MKDFYYREHREEINREEHEAREGLMNCLRALSALCG